MLPSTCLMLPSVLYIRFLSDVAGSTHSVLPAVVYSISWSSSPIALMSLRTPPSIV